MRRPLWIPWRWWRRATQLVLLVVFLWLFRRTTFTGVDQLPGGENILFRLDPLAAASTMLAARQFIAMFWPALVIVGLTLIFGRFFCGWVCPLGTLLDYFHRVVITGPRSLWKRFMIAGPLSLWERVRVRAFGVKNFNASPAIAKAFTPCPSPKERGESLSPSLGSTAKYFLLLTVLVASLFSFPLAGLVDPFSLLVRGMTFWGDPLLYRSVDACFSTADEGWVVDVLQPFIKKHFLPFRPMVFHLAGVSAALLAVIFALEFAARRFWCRYLCPAGAMFGLLTRWSWIKRSPAKVCKTCGDCATACRMDALDPAAGVSSHDCTLCMDCVDLCPKSIVKFGLLKKEDVDFGCHAHACRGHVFRGIHMPTASVGMAPILFQQTASPTKKPRPVDLSRRGVLTGMAAGVAIPAVALAARLGHKTPVAADLLRPPGAADEQTFLDLCIRCGECMKVCPTNVLQPTLFQAGLEGVFAPRLDPRFIFEQSYCEYACTLCGQVCPTGAIPRLTEEEKHARPIGKAYFDHNLCLPWAEGTPCIRCEEMCPAPEKAIKIFNTFKTKDKNGLDVEIQQPYVDRDLCVGCGICESNCTIDGRPAAIRVQRVDASDPGTEFLLQPGQRQP